MSEPLKPCPFCGGAVHLNSYKRTRDGAKMFYVMHDEQEGCVLVDTASHDTEVGIIFDWNRRGSP